MTTDDPLLRQPAVDLAAAMKAGQVSPLELVDAHIAAIERWNPYINALVADRFEEARAEARAKGEQLVRRRARAGLPPFFGVPCTIKESFGVEGMPQTVGNLRRRGKVATRSATTVRRLQEAGAIILGVSNVPEMAMAAETSNLLYGRTSNPHELLRTSGGSSGGEAALVAAGCTPFGLASDTGGSIRMPAAFCGVVGHKPTGGLVPGTGHIPSPSPRASRFTCYGPMCRSARDVYPLLRVLAGPDGEDQGCLALPTEDPGLVSVEELTVYTVVDDGRHTVAPSVKAAQARAAILLERMGARVVEARLPELRGAFDLWGDSLRVTAEKTFASWLADEASETISLVSELVAVARGRPRHSVAALAFVALERFSNRIPFTRGGYEKTLAFKARLTRLLGDDAVLLYPTYPTTAPLHNRTARTPRAFTFSAVWNVLELPSVSVPIGVDGGGLPIGMQIIAGPGRDHLALAAAIAIEEERGGFHPARFPPAAAVPRPASRAGATSGTALDTV